MNCDWEKATLCAFHGATTDTKVSFLACMDEASSDQALAAAKSCASGGGIPFSAIQTCFNGPQGDSLLKTASTIWNTAFPARATVPHTFVNDKDVPANYNSLKTAICATGSFPGCDGSCEI
eukprot:TRINITY_DN12443_c0_g1_i2.p3 TRINITY_DN12443_c0_g1~~TRINITY_DN12443_c0_g1_i2.p3  ORF type:complete len:121 (-),score=27.53 TRINITY_DN12443_c0_g1_i2:531-893(-)